MSTPTERKLKQRIRSQRRGDVLVPVLEEVLEQEERHWRVDDELDHQFMLELFRKRNLAREQGVYSPSMLGACQRQAYLAKLQHPREPIRSVQAHGYFVEGDWRHFKWQFLCWKAQRLGLLELVDVEMRVRSPFGDFAGTIDALVLIRDRPYLVDFKGIRLDEFQRTLRYGADLGYVHQMVGYAMIVNSSPDTELVVKDCLLVAENKPGPLAGQNPIALHETAISVDEHKHEVREKLNVLRQFEQDGQLPPPACVSTRHLGFQDCPFARSVCWDDVRAIQQQREQELLARPISIARLRR